MSISRRAKKPAMYVNAQSFLPKVDSTNNGVYTPRCSPSPTLYINQLHPHHPLNPFIIDFSIGYPFCSISPILLLMPCKYISGKGFKQVSMYEYISYILHAFIEQYGVLPDFRQW